MKLTKKSLLALVLTFALCLIPLFGMKDVSAASTKLYDNAGVLSASEAVAVESALAKASEDAQADIVVYFESTIDQAYIDKYDSAAAQNVADDFSDNGNFANERVVLFVAVESRDWAISTHGKTTIEAVNDDALETIFRDIKPLLSSGSYEAAAKTFASDAGDYIAELNKLNNMSKFEKAVATFKWGKVAIIAIIIGVIAALIRGSMLKSELKSVYTKAEAKDCIKEGSFDLITNRDIFLYRKVDKKLRPKNDDTKSNGSTTHTSSSGETHGGASGKF